tara:strand:+ start:169 stop:318 length:150 start_codon:yes stop_codon:yes gene_type:complete
MVLIGLFGSIAQMAISQSLKETDPAALMPFDFPCFNEFFINNGVILLFV